MKQYIVVAMLMLLFSSVSIAQTLDDYFRIAAESNPALQAAYKEYEAALQKVPQATSLPDPTLSFGYFISPVETRLGPQKARFSLTQMLPWFGTLKAQGNVAALMAEAKFQSFIDERNKLYLRVATAYYPIYELRQLVRIEQDNVDLLKSYKNIATQKFENGSTTMVDVLRVDIMLSDAQTSLNILKDKEIPLLTTFNLLLNRNADIEVITNDTLSAPPLSDGYRKDSLVAMNPMLKALDLKVQSGKASEIVARKQGMPKLGVGLDYVIVGQNKDVTMPNNGKDVIMPMVSVSIPLFRGKYNALVREAQLMQESYSYQMQETENRLTSEYDAVWYEVQKQAQLLSLYNQQIESTQQSLNLLFSSYSNSGKEFVEVLRMQQMLLQYQKMRASAISQYHMAVERMNYITSKTR